jgi:RNA polymerase sigma-70 factor (ECF subfamily)
MDAEDILQEGFVKIFKSIHTIERSNEAVLYPWMRRVLINHALNYLRDHKKYRFVMSVDEINDQIPDISGDDRFEDLLGKAGQQKVQEAISALPDGYRTVFNLYAIEEYTHQEIADALGCSVNTSKTQLMKARRALIAALQSQNKKEEPVYKLVI